MDKLKEKAGVPNDALQDIWQDREIRFDMALTYAVRLLAEPPPRRVHNTTTAPAVAVAAAVASSRSVPRQPARARTILPGHLQHHTPART
jgi:hypothetical protein